jgi:hypothetical protein
MNTSFIREMTRNEKAFLDSRLRDARLEHRVSGTPRQCDDSIIDKALRDIAQTIPAGVRLVTKYPNPSAMASLLIGRLKVLHKRRALPRTLHLEWAEKGATDEVGIPLEVASRLRVYFKEAMTSERIDNVNKALEAVLTVCSRGGVEWFNTGIRYGSEAHHAVEEAFLDLRTTENVNLTFPYDGRAYLPPKTKGKGSDFSCLVRTLQTQQRVNTRLGRLSSRY